MASLEERLATAWDSTARIFYKAELPNRIRVAANRWRTRRQLAAKSRQQRRLAVAVPRPRFPTPTEPESAARTKDYYVPLSVIREWHKASKQDDPLGFIGRLEEYEYASKRVTLHLALHEAGPYEHPLPLVMIEAREALREQVLEVLPLLPSDVEFPLRLALEHAQALATLRQFPDARVILKRVVVDAIRMQSARQTSEDTARPPTPPQPAPLRVPTEIIDALYVNCVKCLSSKKLTAKRGQFELLWKNRGHEVTWADYLALWGNVDQQPQNEAAAAAARRLRDHLKDNLPSDSELIEITWMEGIMVKLDVLVAQSGTSR